MIIIKVILPMSTKFSGYDNVFFNRASMRLAHTLERVKAASWLNTLSSYIYDFLNNVKHAKIQVVQVKFAALIKKQILMQRIVLT